MLTMRRRRYRHLPEGHAPGPQTRRRYGIVQWTTRLVFVLLAVACVGLGVTTSVVAVTGNAGSAGEAVTILVIGIVIALIGVALVRMALRELKRIVEKSASHLQLVVNPADVRRGESLTATLTLPDLAKVGQDQVQVGLVCTEWYETQETVPGRTMPVQQTSEAAAYEEWVPAESRSDLQSFTFRVPVDAPFSYEGDMLSFGWRVAARQLSNEDLGPRISRKATWMVVAASVVRVATRRTDEDVDLKTSVPIWVRP